MYGQVQPRTQLELLGHESPVMGVDEVVLDDVGSGNVKLERVVQRQSLQLVK